MNFIEKIFLGKPDHLIHLQFQKFSRGVFTNRALITAKKSGNKYTISTSAEFGNELVIEVARKLGEKRTMVTGGIISTVNLKEIPQYAHILANATVKQFQGVKNYSINAELSGKEVVQIVEAFPKAFFGLSFKTDDTELKIKAKAPKSAKPKNKDEEKPKADFCKLVTTDENLGKGFVFEKHNFSKASIVHTFVIDSIEVPEHLKKSTDFQLVREESKRKGKIIRDAEIDDEKLKKEINFEA
jgi:hypothetical protein